MKNILITGGGGFIGSHLAKYLSKRYTITIYDIIEVDEKIEGINYCVGDITNLNNVKPFKDRFDGIIHLAALSRVRDGLKSPDKCININVIGTVNVLELARTSVNNPWIIIGGSVESTDNIYGLSKYMGEMCAKRYSQDYFLKTLVLRFATVYGSEKNNLDKLINKLISRALCNQDIIIDDGNKSFDFIYIDDLIAGINLGINYLESIENNSFFDVIPLCTGNSIVLKELSELVVRETDSMSRIIIEDEKNTTMLKYGPVKAKKILKFTAQTKIVEGLRKTIQDIKSKKYT